MTRRPDKKPDGRLQHHKAPRSGANPATLDAYEDPRAELRRASMDELMQRASSLVIPGWRKMDRDELIEALASYSRSITEYGGDRPTIPDL